MIRLLALLKEEESALLSGDYERLRQVSAEKLDLSTRLETGRADTETLGRISQLTHRNARLLQAATAGLDDARRTLRLLKNASTTETYDKSGARNPIADLRPGFERKL